MKNKNICIDLFIYFIKQFEENQKWVREKYMVPKER